MTQPQESFGVIAVSLSETTGLVIFDLPGQGWHDLGLFPFSQVMLAAPRPFKPYSCSTGMHKRVDMPTQSQWQTGNGCIH
jgi:hypothetical protein